MKVGWWEETGKQAAVEQRIGCGNRDERARGILDPNQVLDSPGNVGGGGGEWGSCRQMFQV